MGSAPVTLRTASTVVSAAISLSMSPRGVTSITASSVMMYHPEMLEKLIIH
jgi:hypothetical protein